MSKIRLDKYLTDKGVGSRKQVREIIKKGKIKVDNIVINKANKIIDINNEEVTYNEEKIVYYEKIYLMLNKPQGVISAVSDNYHKTVIDLIPKKYYQSDIFPVGRLDKDTEGLLLLTNDGLFSHNLMSPKKHVEKAYLAEVDKCLVKNLKEEFENGIQLADGYVCKKAFFEKKSDKECIIKIKEGKYHQIKRMLGVYGYGVVRLKRISIGKVLLDEKLELGEIRILNNKEIEALKNE